MKRWINLKEAFPVHLFDKTKEVPDFKSPSTTLKKTKNKMRMIDMLKVCGLELEGKHYSGIDDARNIARCVIKTLESGFEYTQGMVHMATKF